MLQCNMHLINKCMMQICALPECQKLFSNWRQHCCCKSHQAKYAAKSRHGTLGQSNKTKEDLAPYYRFKATERQNRIKIATPQWADQNLIREFYDLADKLTKETGVVHEVDHIIPIRGKFVSGLHVQNNLQVITRTLNREKGNRVNCAHGETVYSGLNGTKEKKCLTQ